MGTTKNQAITERPVIEQKWEIDGGGRVMLTHDGGLISRAMLTHDGGPLVESCLRMMAALSVEPCLRMMAVVESC